MFNKIDQKDNICSLCSASNTFKVKYFQLKDAIRPPDDSQFDGVTELHGVLEKILNITGNDREATNDICQKCRDKLHGIYSLTLQHNESEKIFHQITDVTVRLKKLKTFFILTDLKTEFDAIGDTDKDLDLLECSSTVGQDCAVSGVAVKMECDNNFEGIDFNRAMKELNSKYSNAADGRSVEQRKIDSMGSEDTEQITIEDEIVQEEWALQEGVIFESTAKRDILDREQKKFSCDVCTEEFATVSCLNEHTKYVHENDSYELNQSAVEDSERHIQPFDTKNEFACDQCDADTDSQTQIHSGISFNCDQCDATYKSKQGLNHHKQIHSGISFNCDQCDATYKSKQGLNWHKQIHEGISLNCDQCDATYKSKQALNQHKQIHCGKSFNCDQCDATYKRKQALNQHKLNHSGISFNCDQCDATYKNKRYLKVHKLNHSGIFFNCDQCDATYQTKKGLSVHKQIHSGISFNCDQCDATYKSKRALNLHKQIHSGIFFNCDQCDATYKRKEYLKQHKLNHSVISFNCDQCNATYKSKRYLNVHKLNHCGIFFNCDQCDATYKSKQDLNLHNQIHKGIQSNLTDTTHSAAKFRSD